MSARVRAAEGAVYKRLTVAPTDFVPVEPIVIADDTGLIIVTDTGAEIEASP